MNKKLPISLVLVLLLTCWAMAQTKPVETVMASGFEDDYWIARVKYQTTNIPKPAYITRILKRVDPVSGFWEEYAVMQLRATQIIAFQNGLAMLDDVGKWKLIRARDVAPDGAALPEGYSIVTLAADRDTLYALGAPGKSSSTSPTTLPSSPAIFVLDGNNWKYHSPAPAIENIDHVALDVVRGKIYLAQPRDRSIQIEELISQTWKPFSSLNTLQRFKLVPNSPFPMLATQNELGRWQITRAGESTSTEVDGNASSDLAVIGSTLRVVTVEPNGDLIQTSYPDYGTGKPIGPDPIGQLPIPQQINDVWKQMVFMVLVTVITLMTIRSRDSVETESLAKAGLVIAPLSRRLAAGMVDLAPLVLAIYLTMPNREDGRDFKTEADLIRVAGPSFIGFLIYVAHTMIGELLFRRSFGKWLFGLHVVSMTGSRASAGSIFVRNLLRFVDIGLGAPWIIIIFSNLQQRLGDMAARTIVVTRKIDQTNDQQ